MEKNTMPKEIALMLMSHGNFAKAAIESAELIVGKQTNFDTLSVFTVDNVAHLKQELQEKIDALDTQSGIIFLTDILGGTPMNLASHLLTKENILVCCGLNLPLLLDVVMNRDLPFDEMKSLIKNAYQNGLTIRDFNDLQKQEDEDDLL
ncbi:PTS sugar transporter subunit IIA [Pasteurella sp. 19428wF3_WM03]|uniref:PTS sugar transporter subunit IIA n=2 Tax=unclassified Pasteurella TaxID=2621516 RepID=UPI001D16C58A